MFDSIEIRVIKNGIQVGSFILTYPDERFITEALGESQIKAGILEAFGTGVGLTWGGWESPQVEF